MRTGTFYEVNVSCKGQHVFATDGSIRNYDHFKILELLRLFSEKFPKSEDYEISVTNWQCGCPHTPEEITALVKETWGR